MLPLFSGCNVNILEANDELFGEIPTNLEQSTPDRAKGHIEIIKEWVPTCEEDLKPKIGMEFESLDEGENFYKNYAHHVGFSVRKSSTKNDKKKVVRINIRNLFATKKVSNYLRPK